jgi:hypothetical protein
MGRGAQVLGHGAKFDQKMEQAIAALLSHGNVEPAAREVSVSVTTLLRWMKVPEFRAALQKARRTVASHALGRLQEAAGAAVTTLLKIMLDPNVPPTTRLRAAEIVLERVAKSGELEDIEDRVAKLERTGPQDRRSRRRLTDRSYLSVMSPDASPAQIAAPPVETSGAIDASVTEEDE